MEVKFHLELTAKVLFTPVKGDASCGAGIRVVGDGGARAAAVVAGVARARVRLASAYVCLHRHLRVAQREWKPLQRTTSRARPFFALWSLLAVILQ